MLRTTRAVGSVIAAAALTVAGFAGTASAATENNGRCETGEFCLYQHDDYRGGVHDFIGWDSNHYNDYWYGTTSSVRKGASSLRNKVRSCTVRLWSEAGGTGRYSGFRPSSQTSDLSDWEIDDNSNVSHTYVYCS